MLTAIDILIPTHGRSVLLEQTLESVIAAERPATGLPVRVLVVENGQRGDASAVVERVKSRLESSAEGTGFELEYHYHEPPSKTLALNVGIGLARDGALIVFMDDDVVADPGVLAAYWWAATRVSDRPRFFGGPTTCRYEREPSDALKAVLPASAAGLDLTPADGRLPNFLGFNWAASAADLQRLGGFDQRFGPGTRVPAGDESELQERLRLAGAVQTVVPGAVVEHYVPAERCDAAFAVRRAWVHAVAKAYRLGMYPQLGETMNPWWYTASWLKRAVIHTLTGWRLPEGQRLKRRVWLARQRGFAVGAWRVRRDRPTPVELPRLDAADSSAGQMHKAIEQEVA